MTRRPNDSAATGGVSAAAAGDADRLAELAGIARATELLRRDAYRTAQELLDAGASPSAVARALGMSRQHLYRVLRVGPSVDR